MNFSNCNECGNIFTLVSNEKSCYNCRSKEDMVIKDIQKYIRKKRKKLDDMQEIVVMFNITKEQIYKWVKENKILVSDFLIFEHRCKLCEEQIKYEGVCNDCRKGL